jgi:aryl-alcohol dehydrogenase-like predicted oxidoreductase
VANGRLTARNDNPRFAPAMAILRQQAARLSCSVDALALAAVLAQPWADVTLSGAATAEQVRSNARALEVPWDDEATEATAPLREDSSAYWSHRSEMEWN